MAIIGLLCGCWHKASSKFSVLNFYTELPEYKSRELVLTGESFGGKYLSYAANAVLAHNSETENSWTFDLKSLILSNVLVDVPAERV